MLSAQNILGVPIGSKLDPARGKGASNMPVGSDWFHCQTLDLWSKQRVFQIPMS
jgi:hypothetical protein